MSLHITPSAEVATMASALAAAIPRTRRGVSGDRHLVRGPGASPELEERRPYVLGDELRHIDWRGSLAQDRLLLKLFRAERRPLLELALDLSASMAITPGKAELVMDLAALAGALARQGGAQIRFWLSEPVLRQAELEELERAGLEVGAAAALSLEQSLPTLAPLLRNQGVRWLISDMLSAVDPLWLISTFARGAEETHVMQVLAPFDAAPTLEDALLLVDAEDETTMEVDERALDAYRERFQRHQQALAEACLRCGVMLHTIVATAESRAARFDAAVRTLLQNGALALS